MNPSDFFITYLGSLLVVYLSLVGGVYVATLAREELKKAKPYLLTIQIATLLYILFISTSFFGLASLVIGIPLAIVLFAYLHLKQSSFPVYLVFALLLYEAFGRASFHALLTVGMVLYSVVTGIVAVDKQAFSVATSDILLRHALFVVLGVVAPLLHVFWIAIKTY